MRLSAHLEHDIDMLRPMSAGKLGAQVVSFGAPAVPRCQSGEDDQPNGRKGKGIDPGQIGGATQHRASPAEEMERAIALKWAQLPRFAGGTGASGVTSTWARRAVESHGEGS